MRKTGIAVLGDVPWGTHLCQFYRVERDLLDILLPYFKAGLENNEFLIWVISEPLNQKEVKAALRKAVAGFDQFLRREQMKIIPDREWFL